MQLFFSDKMASRFSGALQITNLDDFITPSQVFHHFGLIAIIA